MDQAEEDRGEKRRETREKRETTSVKQTSKLLSHGCLPPKVPSFERSSISNWKTSGSQLASRGGTRVSFERDTLELGREDGLRWTAGGRGTGNRQVTLIPSTSR